MALQEDIAFSYDILDHMIPIALEAKHPDFTCALYDGDLSLTLTQAQKAKRRRVLAGIDFKAGDRILDIGSGWGNMLSEIRDAGGRGVGITLSPAQVKTCLAGGLEAYLKDWKDLHPKEYGDFDAVISIGAFEHFCSPEEMLAGKQDEIYDRFFRLCHDILPDSGMMFLQTMTWGKHAPWSSYPPSPADVVRVMNLNAPRMSDERVTGLLGAFFPGSWLPNGLDHILACAQPYFDMIDHSNGRIDYIQTITEWQKAWYKPRPGRTLDMLKLVPRFVAGGAKGRAWLYSVWEGSAREAFIRQIFDHYRIFLRKK